MNRLSAITLAAAIVFLTLAGFARAQTATVATGYKTNGMQDWVYMAGEFANDAWAIKQTDGANTQIMLRDYRLILGVERKVIGGIGARLEVGYVFGRRVRYTNDTPDYYPADTLMVRGGLTY